MPALLTALRHCLTAGSAGFDLMWLVLLALRPRAALAAENLFLRKQLALFQERQVKPRRANDATRWLMAAVSRLFNWRMALVVVKPDTLIRWHRKGFRLFWRWKSKPRGRPRLLRNLRQLIRKMAADFFIVITATFRTLYVFVILELGTRRILHYNVTAHPTAEWTLQQFREALPADYPYRFVIHDRDSIFSKELDKAVAELGVRVLRTPVRAPQANSVCERFGGTLRRECLDFLIPLNERHLERILKAWITHFNHGRPHMSLGPGIPEPLQHPPPEDGSRYSIAAGHVVLSKPVLGGLHHEYSLEKVAA